MSKEIRNKLIELARLRTTWSYSQLNEQLQLGLDFTNGHDNKLIGDWLGEISRHEHERGRPLISSLITHKYGKREQGDGFYKLCEELFGEDWEELKADKKWENGIIADCFEFWLNSENYKNFKNDY
ncbi:MAG: hypothetical protein AB7G44_16300 [Bacteroidia bacterium]